MSSQAIKEYGNFAGQDGYVIVDGIDNQTPGGKMLLSNIVSMSKKRTLVNNTTPAIENNKLTINPPNHSLVIITNLPNAAFDVNIVAPQIESDDYIDIIIQTQTNASDYNTHTITANGFANVTMDDYGGKSALDTVAGWTYITLLGRCMTIACEDSRSE